MIPYVSKRWETIIFLAMGVCINYCIRVNLSIAAQEMEDDLNWTEEQKGEILSAFFWGYASGQLPSTLIAGTIGPKYTFGFAIFGSSVLNLFMPVAAKTSFNLAVICRAAIGLACSSCFVSCYHFFPKWIPLAEKTLMVSTVGCGMYLGEILGFALSGFLVGTSEDISIGSLQIGGWPSAFYVFSIIGIIWTPFYSFAVYSTPEQHPYITKAEIDIIQNKSLQAPLLVNDHENGNSQNGRGSLHIDTLVPPSQVSSNSSQNSSLGSAIGDFAVPNSSYSSVANKPSDEFNIREIPWIPMLTHSASLCLLLSNWVFGWIGYMLLTELPSFLNDELGYDIESSGLLSIAPFLANLISVIIFARIFDHLQANKGWTIRGIRQTASQISYLGASFCLIICGFLTVSGAAFTFMVLSLLFFGASQSGIACCFLDISPRYSSIMNTLGNTVGALAGLAGPLVVSALLNSYRDSTAWQIVFFLTFIQSLLALIVFYFYQSDTIVEVLNNPVKR